MENRQHKMQTLELVLSHILNISYREVFYLVFQDYVTCSKNGSLVTSSDFWEASHSSISLHIFYEFVERSL